MNLLYFILPTLAYSFYNLPIRQYSKKINNIENVKIIEPMNLKDKKDIPALVFFSGLSGKIPNEVYNNFLNYVSSSGISCYLFNENIDNSKKLVEYLNNNYSNVTISGHSSGASKAIQLYSECDNLNNLILFDPVDDRIFTTNKINYIFNTLFDKSKNKIEINNIKNYLLVKAENSYKWSLFPPRIPFIPIFDIDEKILSINDDTYIIDNIIEETINENNEIVKIIKTISKKINPNKKCIEIKNFGHTDLLDYYWTKTMRNVLKDNSKHKTFDDLNNYHKCNAYLINQICYNKLDTIKSNLKNENEFKDLKFNTKNI